MPEVRKVTYGTSANGLDSIAKQRISMGDKLYNLAAGDPNTFPDPAFMAGLMEAAKLNIHQYSPVQGDLLLRERLNHEQPERVLISNGAKQLIYMALMATCKPCDKVVIVGPCWPSYVEICKLLDLDYTRVVQASTEDYVPDINMVETACYGAKAILFNNPCNPTGHVYDKEYVKELERIVKEKDMWLIDDEIYSDIIYNEWTREDFYTPENESNVIYINGFSKCFSLTGWRFGYAIGPEEVIDQMTKIQSQMSGPPNTVMQYAINAAWGHVEKDDLAIYRERRDLLCTMSPLFRAHRPTAGFYFYLPIKGDPNALCKKYLQDYRIVMTPGSEYGIYNTIRISFANITKEEIMEIAPYLSLIS